MREEEGRHLWSLREAMADWLFGSAAARYPSHLGLFNTSFGCVACVPCVQVYAEGEWRILCNRRFSNTFSTRDEITRRVEELSVVPSFYYSRSEPIDMTDYR